MRRPFWVWSILSAGSVGCSIYAATEGHGANAAVIGAIAVLGGFGAFRELAHEIADRLKPDAPDRRSPSVVPLRPSPN